MRYPAIAVSALVLLLVACGESKETVTFAWQAPAAGGTVATSYEHLLEPTVGVFRGEEKLREFTQKGERKVVMREEIIEDGESPKIQVTYDVSTMYVPQVASTLDLPTQGHIYVVSEKNGKRHVASAEGRALTPDEMRQVTTSFDILRKPVGLAGFLDGREVAIGETIRIPKVKAGTLFQTGHSLLKASDVTLTLTKTKVEQGATVAVFSAAFQAKGAPKQGLSVRAELAGTVEVLVQGARPLRLELKGTIHLAGQAEERGEPLEFRGSGPMHVKMTGSYEAP